MNKDLLLYALIAAVAYLYMRPCKCGYHDGKSCGS